MSCGLIVLIYLAMLGVVYGFVLYITRQRKGGAE